MMRSRQPYTLETIRAGFDAFNRGDYSKLQEAWGEGFRFEPRSITEGDAVVLVDTRAKGIGVGSSVPIEMTVHIVLRFQDQKIVWSQGFIDRADALEAAGLRE